MTKNEFNEKFNECYKNSLKTLIEPEIINDKLEKYSNGNNKISIEKLAVFAIHESIQFTKDFLHSVLLDVLQFDE